MDNSAENKEFSVSVVITAYNIENYIQRAIDSVLAQTVPPAEIIIIDDGSKDATAEKVKSYGDKVQYIRQENQGPSSARNAGITAAQYDWVAFLDGDDEWLSNNLSLHAAIHKAQPDLKWSAGNFIRCLCEEDRRKPDVDPEKIRSLLQEGGCFSNYFLAHAHRAAGHADTMVIRREVFEQIGRFDQQLSFAEDIKLWWQITLKYPRIGYVSEPIAIYHVGRPGTLSAIQLGDKMDGMIELLQTTRTQAKQSGMSAQFDVLVKFMVTSWIRGLLFKNQPLKIKKLLNTFGSSLSPAFRCLVKLLMLCPKGTALMCRAISKLVRLFKLRKKITRKPTS